MVLSNQSISKVVFSDTYNQQKDQMDTSEVKKLEQAIYVHGYRGASKKKHNGVVPIRPSDKQLWKSLEKFKLEEKELLKTAEENYELFNSVKIVAHVTNGNRAIGIIFKTEDDKLILYLLGFSNYNYQLF